MDMNICGCLKGVVLPTYEEWAVMHTKGVLEPETTVEASCSLPSPR